MRHHGTVDLVQDGDLRQIGPYRLIKELGSGGMGRVYLGRSRGGRAVAVKVVHRELAGDPEFRRRFAAEVAAARQVGGFYTAQVVDADTSADPPWLATAYIPGPSLAEAVGTHGPLPPAAVRLLGAGLAEGLSAIHACGLVHRDLTHRNVILADDGPRVIDFGIAKALDTVHLSTSVIGTPGFMSPEQATGGRVGPESDVFSLGCVLAYAARGTGPFGGGRPDLVVYRVVHQEPDLAGVPGDLVPLLRSCLAKNPAERPALDDVLDRLAPHVDGFATAAWLPPDVTAMIAERGAVMRDAPGTPAAAPALAPGAPGLAPPLQPGTPAAGQPLAPDAPAAGRPFMPDAPGAGQSPEVGAPHVGPPAAGAEPGRGPQQAPAPRRGGMGTAHVAIILALLCLPGLVVWAIKYVQFVLLDEDPLEAWGGLVVSVAAAGLLARGALLLSQRSRAGRWMIVGAGSATAVLNLSSVVRHFPHHELELLDFASFGTVLIVIVAPLAAVVGAAAALLAALPSTGRWCRSG